MRSYIFLLMISFFYLNSGFSSENDNSIYYSELKKFNRGFFIQVLSDPFCLQSESTNSDKLISIKNFKNIINDFPDEPGVNDFDAAGMAPLHYLAITRIETDEDYSSIKEISNILIYLGANVNLPNKFGISPLSLAINYGNYGIVDSFLACGKLKKDLNIFKIIFSDLLDSKWQIYRFNFIFGRIQICNLLQKAWLKDINSSDFEIIQIKFEEILNQLYKNLAFNSISPKGEKLIKNDMLIIQNILSKSVENLNKKTHITLDNFLNDFSQENSLILLK